MSLRLALFILSVWISVCQAGCPFASMGQQYNFSGYWSYNDSLDGNAYMFKLCHLEDQEVYFTMARNDTPSELIGFGSGNWTQHSMMIGGLIYKTNNQTLEPTPFGIGMNQQTHEWWYQDAVRSNPIDQHNKEHPGSDECMIPYGMDARKEYFVGFWNAKRLFHRKIRMAKRKREQAKKRKLRAEKKKPSYVKYYEWAYDQFMEFVNGPKPDSEDLDALSAEENAKFEYKEKAEFPNLFESSWMNTDNSLTVTFVDGNNACINGEQLTNLTSVHSGAAVTSYIESTDGLRNGQYFMITDENTLKVAYATLTRDETNAAQLVEHIKLFDLKRSDNIIPCSNTQINEKSEQTKMCNDDDASNGEKCDHNEL